METPLRRRLIRMNQTALLAIAYASSASSVPNLSSAPFDSSPSKPEAPSGSTLVATSSGPVQGFVKNHVLEFLGIPYAAPPVGGLRWLPPQPPTPWTTPLVVQAFGNTCPQSDSLGVFAKPSATEACLYLNVFTPAIGSGRRVVEVWIHGGGLFDGESNDYDGSALARRHDAVVVTFNYRIGVLGWLAHPALDAEGHAFGNYGLMDQQFALRWVQRNIGRFGGNPRNVTIFGESAGGLSVLGNLASPAAARLFQRAIVQSGAYELTTTSLSAALHSGTDFATAAGCVDQTAACLRALSVQQILGQQGSYLTGLMVDGVIVPRSLDVAFSAGRFNRVPIMNGSDQDEMRFFTAVSELTNGHALASAEYAEAVTAQYGPNAGKALTEYPLRDYPSPSEALSASETDSIFACPAYRLDVWLSHYVPTYAYEFSDHTAPSFMPPVSFPYGAAHTLELQYLFPLYHGGQGAAHPLDAAQEILSQYMLQYWTAFAKAGNPNVSPSPTHWRWPRFSPGRDNIQSLQVPHPVTGRGFIQRHQCAFWNRLPAVPM
jgi:para-nitrobenzyl esterase